MSARSKLAAAISLAIACCLATPVAFAQDSFSAPARQQSNQQPMPTRPMQSAPASRLPEMAMPASMGSGEAQDFGVAATRQLRPSQQLHGPTPTSIPGGKVIGTRQLSEMLQRGQDNVLLLHAYGAPEHLPGAQAVAPASQGGRFDDQVQREFGQYLRQASGGDTARILVVYCAGPQCWGSYNAALRAIHMGFHNVYWYRGGIEAWGQAGLPLQDARGQRVSASGAMQQGAPAQRQQ